MFQKIQYPTSLEALVYKATDTVCFFPVRIFIKYSEQLNYRCALQNILISNAYNKNAPMETSESVVWNTGFGKKSKDSRRKTF